MPSRTSSARPAERLLIVDGDPPSLAHVAALASRLGLPIDRANDRCGLEDGLRASGSYAIIVVSASAPTGRSRSAFSDEDSAALVGLVSSVHRHAPGAQLLVAMDRPLARERCSQLIQAGVQGFLQVTEGTVNPVLLREQIERALRRHRQSRTESHPASRDDIFEVTGFVGCSRAMRDVLQRAVRAARISDVPVLIYGESGTGKQLLAETIHRLDAKRGHRRILSVNCAAMNGPLADSALFGHTKGAFTGATESRLGHFRAADGGTVLLDEIGELDLALQPKLLRVLQEGLVLPVGADEEKPVDVRVIAATNRRLEAQVEEGRFRLDLFQRLNVIRIEVPPLSERPEDIPLLVRHFVKRYADYYPRPLAGVDDDALNLLMQQRLRGNVRELENVIRRTLAFKTRGDRIMVEDLASVLHDAGPAESTASAGLAREVVESACRMLGTGQATFTDVLDECERLLLSRLMEQSGRTHTDLARDLGLSRRTLYNKRKKHQL